MNTAPPTTPDDATIVDADEEAVLAWFAGLQDREQAEFDAWFDGPDGPDEPDFDGDAADREADRQHRALFDRW